MHYKKLFDRVANKLGAKPRTKEYDYIKFICWAYFEYIKGAIMDPDCTLPVTIPRLIMFKPMKNCEALPHQWIDERALLKPIAIVKGKGHTKDNNITYNLHNDNLIGAIVKQTELWWLWKVDPEDVRGFEWGMDRHEYIVEFEVEGKVYWIARSILSKFSIHVAKKYWGIQGRYVEPDVNATRAKHKYGKQFLALAKKVGYPFVKSTKYDTRDVMELENEESDDGLAIVRVHPFKERKWQKKDE